MDQRNYTITNLAKKQRRINPDSSTDDLNETDVDFDVQLADDSKGNPNFIKVSDYSSIDSQKLMKIDYVTDEEKIVKLDDLVTSEFRGKSTFKFIFSLSDMHKYRYEVKLNKGKELTYRRMIKIICQSAKHVLEDTLKFVGGKPVDKRKNPDIIGDDSENSEDDVPTENNNSGMNGGGLGTFDVGEKLDVLEIEYMGVQKKGNRIFVEFSGFEDESDIPFVY
jgi:hypothetical protein